MQNRNNLKKENTDRGYFRSTWKAVYRFWALLIWAPKLGKLGVKKFVKVNIDISCKYQRSAQLLYETLDISIEALTAFTVTQS